MHSHCSTLSIASPILRKHYHSTRLRRTSCSPRAITPSLSRRLMSAHRRGATRGHRPLMRNTASYASARQKRAAVLAILRASNVQGRTNRELKLKRRSRVILVFPSRKSLIRMLGAVFAEMDKDRTFMGWFTEESAAKAYSAKTGTPGRSYGSDAGTYVRRIIDLAVADRSAEKWREIWSRKEVGF